MSKIYFCLFLGILAFDKQVRADDGPESQLVVVHSKGENFPSEGISSDDPRIQEHGKYWRQSGIVERGGPVPGTGGGMMLIKRGTSPDLAQRVAEGDPAFKSKLLKADVRQWVLVIDNASPAPAKKNSAGK